jgi:hypothetical protein
MFFQSEVHLLSFEQSSGGHWALDRCFYRYTKWKGTLTFCCPWDIFDLLDNAAPTWKQCSFLGIAPISLLQHLTNFGTTLAEFHKKLDVNLLFQLLFNLHLDSGWKRVTNNDWRTR